MHRVLGQYRHSMAAVGMLTLFFGGPTETLIAETLKSGWNEIAPGGQTICARGAPFSFFVYEGDPSHVIVDFIGGGACWDNVSCAKATATFTDSVDSVRDIISEGQEGVYDKNNPKNPYRNWTHVVIPYCTGDLHWGNATRTYTSGGAGDFTIHHKGAVNSAAVLDWVKQQYYRTARVHVNGCSAGSYGSIFWTPYIQEQHRAARITQFGDAGAGVMTPGVSNQGIVQWNINPAAPRWVPGLDPRDTDYSRLALDEFYNRVARHYPYTNLAQFNTSFDFVQTYFFVQMGGRQEDWNPGMRGSIDRIIRQSPSFRSFISPGDRHCATIDDDLYETESDGVNLADWLRDYVELAPVGHVDCGNNCQ